MRNLESLREFQLISVRDFPMSQNVSNIMAGRSDFEVLGRFGCQNRMLLLDKSFPPVVEIGVRDPNGRATKALRNERKDIYKQI